MKYSSTINSTICSLEAKARCQWRRPVPSPREACPCRLDRRDSPASLARATPGAPSFLRGPFKGHGDFLENAGWMNFEPRCLRFFCLKLLLKVSLWWCLCVRLFFQAPMFFCWCSMSTVCVEGKSWTTLQWIQLVHKLPVRPKWKLQEGLPATITSGAVAWYTIPISTKPIQRSTVNNFFNYWNKLLKNLENSCLEGTLHQNLTHKGKICPIWISLLEPEDHSMCAFLCHIYYPSTLHPVALQRSSQLHQCHATHFY